MQLTGMSVVLTGATGGIGEPLCRQLVAGGARVLLVGRRADRLAQLATTLVRSRAAGRADTDRGDDPRLRVDVIAADVSTLAGRQAVVAAAETRNANVLIHGAAVPAFGPLQELDDRSLAAVLATDLFAPIALTRDLLPVLANAPSASILMIGSALGDIGVPGFAAYGAAKSGLRTFTEALRRELAGGPIRVQYLAARATRTSFNDARVDRFNQLTGTAIDRADDVAAAIVAMLRSGRSVRRLGGAERFFSRLNALLGPAIDSGFGKHRKALATVSREATDAAPASKA